MRAAIFEEQGFENLEIKDVQKPDVLDYDVLIKVISAGVNPIDYYVISGYRTVEQKKEGQKLKQKAPQVTELPVSPIPHIPGAEFAGVVEKTGPHVRSIKKGDRVTIYNRIFDNTCDMCVSGNEMLCRTGGLISVVNNGGFSEYVAIPEMNVFKIPDNINWNTAVSLPVSGLTAFHALKEAQLKINDILLIFGASGNTGMIAVQLGKRMASRVIAVSTKKWIKDEYGADYLITDYNDVVNKVKDITNGKMADIVLNSLGKNTWKDSFSSIGINGRWISFGTMTGNKVDLNIQELYSKQLKLIGSNGGNREEFRDLIEYISYSNSIDHPLKIKVWKKFNLENIEQAFEALIDLKREGRVLLDINKE
ncbi:MAG TPA: alcohol dehydrogenase catalytic domain-containing protein [Nitrososphaeraceae archaeon]|nr:alcohol dehydrogenase catalytic domain-containing protein [Nitrososphaeraceae archaeon]